jgi:hypothetical protein
MSDLRRNIEDMLSAITFAEGGEFETAREFVAVKKRTANRVRDSLSPSLPTHRAPISR